MITLADIRRILQPLRMRVQNSIARAVVQLVDDGKKLQEMQIGVLKGQDIPDAEHFQQYGLTSVPLEGAEAVVLFPNGDQGLPYVVATDDRRYRPTGNVAGEVFLYTDEGDLIKLGRGNILSVISPDVRLGSATASDPVALKSGDDDLKSRIAAWTPVANDGGASLKAIFSAWSAPGATKVKAE